MNYKLINYKKYGFRYEIHCRRRLLCRFLCNSVLISSYVNLSNSKGGCRWNYTATRVKNWTTTRIKNWNWKMDFYWKNLRSLCFETVTSVLAGRELKVIVVDIYIRVQSVFVKKIKAERFMNCLSMMVPKSNTYPNFRLEMYFTSGYFVYTWKLTLAIHTYSLHLILQKISQIDFLWVKRWQRTW